MSDLVFRRIRGRIVPIKKKEKEGIAQVGAAGAVATGTGLVTAKYLQKSYKAFGRSAGLRGISKLALGKGKVYNKTIREAATYKVAGKIFARKATMSLIAGSLAASAIGFMGTQNAAKRIKDDEKRFAFSSGVGGIAALTAIKIASKKTKTEGLLKILKAQGKHKSPSAYMALWSKWGQRKTADTIKKFESAAYKGNTKTVTLEKINKIRRKKASKPDGSQLKFDL